VKRRDLGLVAVALLFLAGSAWLIADGQLGLGITGLLFSLAGLVIPLAQRVPDGSGARLEGSQLIVTVRPPRRVLIVLGALLFTAMGALMLASGALFVQLVGGLTVLVFGFFTAVGAWKLRGPWRLVMTRDGMRWDAGSTGPFVAWDDVARAYVMETNGAEILALDLERPDALPRSRLARVISRADRAVGAGDVNVPLGQLSVDNELLLSLVTVCAREPEARGSIASEATVRHLQA